MHNCENKKIYNEKTCEITKDNPITSGDESSLSFPVKIIARESDLKEQRCKSFYMMEQRPEFSNPRFTGAKFLVNLTPCS